jgi:hypothetical protein
LEYAKKITRKSGEEKRPQEYENLTKIQCEEAGGVWVKPHKKRGMRVGGYCRKESAKIKMMMKMISGTTILHIPAPNLQKKKQRKFYPI